MADMAQEHRCLEMELQRRVIKARMYTDGVTPETFEEAFQLVTIEKAALTRENLVLQDRIAAHVKFQTMLDHDSNEIMQVPCKDSTSAAAEVTKAKAKHVPLNQLKQ
ncbi:unnamed protein product [Phytophthora fragariaefolia]|uniref:Unnamed protein product n=1 Tax=Phytophthora fragariaefolia TaxID=1490495 RepID=A0A9W7D4S8_9STRA|nr:unnamed protein product [Phytophthora fragariaefolia]